MLLLYGCNIEIKISIVHLSVLCECKSVAVLQFTPITSNNPEFGSSDAHSLLHITAGINRFSRAFFQSSTLGD